MTLEDLYNELGTVEWAGVEEGWHRAIEAVRERLLSEIGKEDKAEPTNALGMTDEDIQKAYEELQESINKEIGTIPVTLGKYSRLVEKFTKQISWSKCPVCGRDEKYSSGLGLTTNHCKYDCTNKNGRSSSSFYDQLIQPRTTCLFDAIDDWSDTPIMGLACTCPKCSPR